MRYRLLGPLEVTRQGDHVRLGGPKQRLVLAHLLIRANHVVAADTLIDEIWGEEPPEAARASLQSYVSNLRRALGPECLIGQPPGYVLHAQEGEIDSLRFQALVTACARPPGDRSGNRRADLSGCPDALGGGATCRPRF